MAEQSEIKQFLETVIKKVGGVADDVRTNSFKLDRLEQKVDRLSSDFQTLSSQFNDVGVVAIKDSGRIDGLEKRVGDLEANIH